MFEGGFPTPETIQRAYDEADLNRAVQTFRFFYPSVSMMAIWKGNLAGGVAPNQVFAVLEGTPRQLVFTPNSDTPLQRGCWWTCRPGRWWWSCRRGC